jgi:hypothetical protein
MTSFPSDWLPSTVAGEVENRKERSLTGGTLSASLLAIGSWFSIEDDRLLQWSWTPLHFPRTPQFGVLINQYSSEVVPTKTTRVHTCSLESGTWEPKPRRISENNWNFETSEHHSSAAKEQIINNWIIGKNCGITILQPHCTYDMPPAFFECHRNATYVLLT